MMKSYFPSTSTSRQAAPVYLHPLGDHPASGGHRRVTASRLVFLALAALPLAAATAAEQPLRTLDPRPAPGFVLEQLSGEKLDLASLQGRTVILNFWATWCPPCREEMPGLQRAWEQTRDDGIVVVGIAVGEDRQPVAEYVQAAGLGFPVVLDPDTEATMAWGVRGLPTSYVIDPSGQIVFAAEGEREWDDPALLDRVRALAR